MRYIFGPVPSRRLGFSLGVDLLPFKTCTFDCIYCELGKTVCTTVEAAGSIRPEAVLDELKALLSASAPALDFITVSGSGEPTLHPDLGLIIREIKKMATVPVALITNASLLFKDEVMERALEADVIVPSLDAPDRAVFETVNRPHASLTFDQLITGLINLSRRRGPRVWLEILLLKGLNDTPGHIERFRQLTERINPEKIQLNTVVRPPVETYARPVGYSHLKEIQNTFGPQTEIISGSSRGKIQPEGLMAESKIKDMVARRPCTAEDIAQFLGLPLDQTILLLDGLIQKKIIRFEPFDRQRFYRGL